MACVWSLPKRSMDAEAECFRFWMTAARGCEISRIFVVDEEAHMRRICRVNLERAGHRVTEAAANWDSNPRRSPRPAASRLPGFLVDPRLRFRGPLGPVGTPLPVLA
jgi:hypothetical protein